VIMRHVPVCVSRIGVGVLRWASSIQTQERKFEERYKKGGFSGERGEEIASTNSPDVLSVREQGGFPNGCQTGQYRRTVWGQKGVFEDLFPVTK